MSISPCVKLNLTEFNYFPKFSQIVRLVKKEEQEKAVSFHSRDVEFRKAGPFQLIGPNQARVDGGLKWQVKSLNASHFSVLDRTGCLSFLFPVLPENKLL